MKRRDMIGLVIAIAIFVAAGVLLYSQLAPAPQDSGIKVTIPRPVTMPLDEADTSQPNDRTKLDELKKLTDFSTPQKCIDQPDRCGGNTQIFGQ
ncbi:hypothetical protein IT415_00290 [bacterium]|nr:hypothetical protein [bacterium]